MMKEEAKESQVMTNADVIAFVEKFQIFKSFSGFKFLRFLHRNFDAMKTEVDIFRKSMEPTAEFMEYLKEVQKLEIQYSERDPEGNLLRNDQGYPYIYGRVEEFNSELEKLQEKHREVYDERKKKVEEIEKWMKEPTDVSLFYIQEDDIPEDINSEQFKLIKKLIVFND